MLTVTTQLQSGCNPSILLLSRTENSIPQFYRKNRPPDRPTGPAPVPLPLHEAVSGVGWQQAFACVAVPFDLPHFNGFRHAIAAVCIEHDVMGLVMPPSSRR